MPIEVPGIRISKLIHTAKQVAGFPQVDTARLVFRSERGAQTDRYVLP